MRAFVMSLVLGLVVFAWSGMARAQVVERAANAVAGAANAAVNVGANVNADSNMRFHNGRWWYWQPNNNHWMVYHDNQWFAPNSTGGYFYSDGRPLWGSRTAIPYSSGYRGNYGYNNRNYYGNGYYNNGRYYGNGYGYNNGYYGNNYYGRGGYGYGNQGANIGGAIGGGRGASIGAAIGGAIDR